MARYRRWNKTPNGYSRAQQHMAERRAVSASVGGIDKDVLEIFFNLGSSTLESVFRKYQQLHGLSAGNYARDAYPRWKSGYTKVSGQTASRLIDLVPQFLSSGERYELLRKLYHQNRRTQFHSVELVLGADNSTAISRIHEASASLCAAPDLNTLPPHIKGRIEWVCNQDGEAARRLMAALEKEQSLRIAQGGRVDVERLIAAVSRIDTSVEGRTSIEFPYGCLVVQVRKRDTFEKIGAFFSGTTSAPLPSLHSTPQPTSTLPSSPYAPQSPSSDNTGAIGCWLVGGVLLLLIIVFNGENKSNRSSHPPNSRKSSPVHYPTLPDYSGTMNPHRAETAPPTYSPQTPFNERAQALREKALTQAAELEAKRTRVNANLQGLQQWYQKLKVQKESLTHASEAELLKFNAEAARYKELWDMTHREWAELQENQNH